MTLMNMMRKRKSSLALAIIVAMSMGLCSNASAQDKLTPAVPH